MKTTYTYTIQRYTHDPSTGGFVNVGVALYAPELPFAGALCRTTYERFSCLFPDFDGGAFRSITRFVDSRFRALHEKLQGEFAFGERPESVMELAHSVLPHDDASFSWSEPAGGITDDPAAALRKIYARMVSRYDEKADEGGGAATKKCGTISVKSSDGARCPAICKTRRSLHAMKRCNFPTLTRTVFGVAWMVSPLTWPNPKPSKTKPVGGWVHPLL